MKTILELINKDFNRRLAEQKLAESTKISYLARMNVIGKLLAERNIHFLKNTSLNDIKSVIYDLKTNEYSPNRINSLITAYSKFEQCFVHKSNRVSNYIKRDSNIVSNLQFKHSHTYMPIDFVKVMDRTVELASVKSEKDRLFKLGYQFLKLTGLRDGALLSNSDIKDERYQGINKNQVIFNNNGSVKIVNIYDKYKREKNDQWTLTLPKDHAVIPVIKELMKSSSDKLINMSQKEFQVMYKKVDFKVKSSPDIIEKYGNLLNNTPHTLRHNYIHYAHLENVKNGIDPALSYEIIANQVGHQNSEVTRQYDK